MLHSGSTEFCREKRPALFMAICHPHNVDFSESPTCIMLDLSCFVMSWVDRWSWTISHCRQVLGHSSSAAIASWITRANVLADTSSHSVPALRHLRSNVTFEVPSRDAPSEWKFTHFVRCVYLTYLGYFTWRISKLSYSLPRDSTLFSVLRDLI